MHTARRAFEAASQRTGRLISLDKANVLASSVLWRQTVTRLAAEYPKVALEHRFIDTAAMDVIRAPQDFDVILTGNVFGDILADELAQLSGIAPQLGSAELAPDGRGLYTLNQLHYPGENLAGQGKVCPLGILAATAMLLRYTCHRPDAAQAVEQAIDTVISAHWQLRISAEKGIPSCPQRSWAVLFASVSGQNKVFMGKSKRKKSEVSDESEDIYWLLSFEL